MQLQLLAAVCMAASAAPTFAQQVVFHDGFESGLSNWTASGMWNLEDANDTCGDQAAPYTEGTKAAWFGREDQCDFDGGWGVATVGSLTLNAFVDLPDAPSISLRFWSWSQTEYCWDGWDIHRVHIEAQNGPDADFTQSLCSTLRPGNLLLPWHERRIDLSAYRGGVCA